MVNAGHQVAQALLAKRRATTPQQPFPQATVVGPQGVMGAGWLLPPAGILNPPRARLRLRSFRRWENSKAGGTLQRLLLSHSQRGAQIFERTPQQRKKGAWVFFAAADGRRVRTDRQDYCQPRKSVSAEGGRVWGCAVLPLRTWPLLQHSRKSNSPLLCCCSAGCGPGDTCCRERRAGTLAAHPETQPQAQKLPPLRISDTCWGTGTRTPFPAGGSLGGGLRSSPQRTALWIFMICTFPWFSLCLRVQVRISKFFRTPSISNLLPNAENMNRAWRSSGKKDHFLQCDFPPSLLLKKSRIIGVNVSKIGITFPSPRLMKYWFAVHLEKAV